MYQCCVPWQHWYTVSKLKVASFQEWEVWKTRFAVVGAVKQAHGHGEHYVYRDSEPTYAYFEFSTSMSQIYAPITTVVGYVRRAFVNSKRCIIDAVWLAYVRELSYDRLWIEPLVFAIQVGLLHNVFLVVSCKFMINKKICGPDGPHDMLSQEA